MALVPPRTDAPRTVTVETVEERGDNEVLLTFAEVGDLSTAEAVAGCRCLVREEAVDLTALDEADDLPSWEGWSVEDVCAGPVGQVAALDDRAMQPLLVVRRPDGSEALIPLVDEFIEALDETDRVIRLACPAGLLDL